MMWFIDRYQKNEIKRLKVQIHNLQMEKASISESYLKYREEMKERETAIREKEKSLDYLIESYRNIKDESEKIRDELNSILNSARKNNERFRKYFSSYIKASKK